MAQIGSFGDLTFKVSDKSVLEYMGPEIETISFSMVFSVFLGVTPLKQIKKLRKMIRKGYAERLVIGGKVYGNYKWVMEKGTVELQKFDKNGNLWAAKVNVTLKEYPKR